MALVDELIERHFGRRGDELLVGGVPIGEVAERFGTPLFVYDRGVMERSLKRLRRALPRRFEVFYSIKANPNPAVLEFFVGQGCGLEVASAGELQRALAAGCAPERVLFAGPGKTVRELEYAVARGIGEIHVESFEEIAALSRIGRERGTAVRVAVRVNPGGEAQGGAMRMGGKPSPFGFDEELLDEVLERVSANPELRFTGVHLYAGTQILDYRVLARQYGTCIQIARRAAERMGQPLETVDFGGGLGIPYYANDSALDVESFGREVATLMAGVRDEPAFGQARFIVEPGRYLVGESGIYVCRVSAVKRSRGKTFVVVDGGMHHHLAASGNLGQVIKRNYPVGAVNRLDAPNRAPVDVVGPLCTPLDCLARDVELPDLQVGDLVGVFQSGAYAITASPVGFLSHPAPAEIEVGNAVARDTGSSRVDERPRQSR